MGTDSRRKPGGKQFGLALKGLPWQEPYKSKAPYTRATATPGVPCLGCVCCSPGCSLQSHICKDGTMAASWPASWGSADPGSMLDHRAQHTVERAQSLVWKIPEGRQAPSGPVTSQPLMRNNKAQVLTGWSGTSNQDSTCPWSAPW